MKKRFFLCLLCVLLSSCQDRISVKSDSSASESDSALSLSSKDSTTSSGKSSSSTCLTRPEKTDEFTDDMLKEISLGASFVCEVFHQTCWSQMDDDGKMKDFISGSKNWIDIQFTPDEYSFQLYEDCEVGLNKDPDLYTPTKNEIQREGNYVRDPDDASKLKMKTIDDKGRVVYSAPMRGEKRLSEDFMVAGLYDFFADLSSDMFKKTNVLYTFVLDDDILENESFCRRVSNAMTGGDPFSSLVKLEVKTNGRHVSEFVVTTEDTSFSYGNLRYVYHHTYTATILALGDDDEVREHFLVG